MLSTSLHLTADPPPIHGTFRPPSFNLLRNLLRNALVSADVFPVPDILEAAAEPTRRTLLQILADGERTISPQMRGASFADETLVDESASSLERLAVFTDRDVSAR